MKFLVGQILKGYKKFLSPFFGTRCRFFPTCSDYAREAVEKKGAFYGMNLALLRLLKCHPLHPGGWDPLG